MIIPIIVTESQSNILYLLYYIFLLYIIIYYIFVPEASGLHTYEHYFNFLNQSDFSQFHEDNFWSFFSHFIFVKGEEKGLTEVSGPKLSFYKTINNPIELCIFSLATVSLSANVVSKYMHAPCKVKIHHHGCFWMYFTCFSSGRRTGSKLPTFNSLTWFFQKKGKKYPLDFIKLCKALPKKLHFRFFM